MPGRLVLHTIGHSNHSLDTFLGLLREYRIEVLADTRSSPYSKYVPHFNREDLRATLPAAGVKYLDLGRELGGRPEGDEYYDEDGRVLYGRLAESALFRGGIERLETGIRRFRVAILCSEEDPRICHRHLLVSRVMDARGADVVHIRGDGRTERYAECVEPSLFGPPEEEEWKSLQSVSRRRRPSNSSEPSSDTESADWSMSD